MGTFLAIIFVGIGCFIASPIVLFFVLRNNQDLAAWVVDKLIKKG